MYLTQMHLNPARRGTRHLLASPQRMHAAVMSAFVPGTAAASDAGRVLWRVDRHETTCTLFISSPHEPELTHLVEQAGWPAAAAAGWRTVATGAFLGRLEKEQQWVFRLTANPVRSEPAPNGGRGKRYGHVTVGQQEEWLRSRSAGWGFDTLAVSVTNRRHLSFERRTGDRSRSVTLATATFDGLLRVTDPDALRAMLVSGAGRAKGYGCGLMTLAPAR
ncbi:type I-E CRISPR-associated protein Cas6/Cse3/CasE [Nocardioides sp. NPDC101246]|uniref:type I-E CRISPR-associated protein Cas6/Cse3/CasE n=1 Tax=Nocardioides sp. NPDC101246 TaxID=3364336 RepID=UPI00381688A9